MHAVSSSLGGGGATSALLVIAVLAFLVYRQIIPRRLSARSLLLVPVVILYFLWRSLASFHATDATVLDTALDAAVTLVVGLLAAQQLRLYPDPDTGRAMVGGSLRYFLWWLAAFVVKSALAVAFGMTSPAAVAGFEILLPVFILVASRNAYLYWRAMRLGLPLH